MQLYCEHTCDLLIVLQYCLSNSHRRKEFILNASRALEQADSKHTHWLGRLGWQLCWYEKELFIPRFLRAKGTREKKILTHTCNYVKRSILFSSFGSPHIAIKNINPLFPVLKRKPLSLPFKKKWILKKAVLFCYMYYLSITFLLRY